VELGKTIAFEIRKEMERKNRKEEIANSKISSTEKFYIDMLFSG